MIMNKTNECVVYTWCLLSRLTLYPKENYNLDGMLKNIEHIGGVILQHPAAQVWDEIMQKASKEWHTKCSKL